MQSISKIFALNLLIAISAIVPNIHSAIGLLSADRRTSDALKRHSNLACILPDSNKILAPIQNTISPKSNSANNTGCRSSLVNADRLNSDQRENQVIQNHSQTSKLPISIKDLKYNYINTTNFVDPCFTDTNNCNFSVSVSSNAFDEQREVRLYLAQLSRRAMREEKIHQLPKEEKTEYRFEHRDKSNLPYCFECRKHHNEATIICKCCNQKYKLPPHPLNSDELALSISRRGALKKIDKWRHDNGLSHDINHSIDKRVFVPYRPEGLSYLKNLDLMPERLVIWQHSLDNQMVEFVNETGDWMQEVKIFCEDNPFNKTQTIQFSICVKYLSPLVADIANLQDEEEKAKELLTGLQKLGQFVKGAVKTAGVVGLTAAGCYFGTAFFGSVFVAAQTGLLLYNLCNNPLQSFIPFTDLYNSLMDEKYEEAGAAATRCCLTPLEFTATMKCLKGVGGVIKSAVFTKYSNGIFKFCITGAIFAERFKKNLPIADCPIIARNIVRKPTYKFRELKKRCGKKIYETSIDEFENLKLPQKECEEAAKFINNEIPEKLILIPETIEHVTAPIISQRGNTFSICGFHFDENSKFQNLNILKIYNRVINNQGFTEYQWGYENSKIKNSTFIPSDWSLNKIFQTFIYVLNNPTGKTTPTTNGCLIVQCKDQNNLFWDYIIHKQSGVIKSIYPSEIL